MLVHAQTRRCLGLAAPWGRTSVHRGCLSALVLVVVVVLLVLLLLVLRLLGWVAVGAWPSVLAMLLGRSTEPFFGLFLVGGSVSILLAVLVPLALVVVVATRVGWLARLRGIIVVTLIVHLYFRLLTTVHFQ